MIKKLPAGEIVWVEMLTEGRTFYTTSDKNRIKYSLYEVFEDGYEMISSSENPMDFNKIVFNYKENNIPEKKSKNSPTKKTNK